MHELIINQFNQSRVRIVMLQDVPWFIAKDVSDVLGYVDSNAMCKRLDDDETQKVKPADLSGFGDAYIRNDLTIINESGLYNAILGSTKPEARAFKKWVTSEVLPKLRATGNYSLKVAAPQTYGEALLAHAQAVLANEKNQRLLAEQQPKVEYYDQIIDSGNYYTMANACKRVNEIIDYQIGRNTMFRLLRDKGVLMDREYRDSYGKYHHTNEPYQSQVDAGRFVIKPGANSYAKSQTFVTDKGLEYLRNLVLSMSDLELSKYAHMSHMADRDDARRDDNTAEEMPPAPEAQMDILEEQ